MTDSLLLRGGVFVTVLVYALVVWLMIDKWQALLLIIPAFLLVAIQLIFLERIESAQNEKP
jgi:Na+-transporting NADH:ubiquinone oxidoreductase subunit NqrB